VLLIVTLFVVALIAVVCLLMLQSEHGISTDIRLMLDQFIFMLADNSMRVTWCEDTVETSLGVI
jgi:hypothetical protein